MNCFLSERDKDLEFILYALYSTSLQYSHYLRKKQRNVICADDLKRCHMDKRKQDIAYFISFCIEQYKNEKESAVLRQWLCWQTWHLGPVALYQDFQNGNTPQIKA